MSEGSRTEASTRLGAIAEVGLVFLRLGLTAFGGPAAHVALIDRECVERRQWLSRPRFLEIFGVSNLIPGPTSTELAMHIGRHRAGWGGLVLAGLAFILPSALLAAALAALYVRVGDLPLARGVLAAVQPVVIVVIAQALYPLSRAAIRSVPMAALAAAVALLALAGIEQTRILLLAGVVHLLVGRPVAITVATLALLVPEVLAVAGVSSGVALADVAGYFFRIGSLLFGSGYVLFPILERDLVQEAGWLTQAQLVDAIAAGQATPGPVFTTATFIGFILGGPMGSVVATVAIFLPAFLFSALSTVVFERLRRSRAALVFLEGVNAAAVALIGVVVIRLSMATLIRPLPVAIALGAVIAIFWVRLNSALVLLAAAVIGALASIVW